MEICNKNKCTGCYACVNVCPHDCIKMQEDEYGKLIPHINEDLCVKCNLCLRTCPNNVDLEYNNPQICYASWIKDRDKRRICASGGIGTIMSEYVINNNGIVFGSCYNEKMIPVMTYAQTLDELEKFKGSRYVQSIVGDNTLKQVKYFIKTGCLVLFIGTPCQIAGLKTYLRKDYENLITVDLICHGVSPTKYLQEEVSYLSQKYKLLDITDIRFRGNDGNNYGLTLWNKDKQKIFPKTNTFKRIFHLNNLQQYYILGFLKGISLRENCYTCKYARPERISDITIGDFIGLGNVSSFNYSTKNVSSVLINTKKGNIFYNQVSSNISDLKNVERNYKERLEYGPSLKYPFPRHILNIKFNENYLHIGYVKAIRKTLKSYMYKDIIYNIAILPIRIVKHILK